MSAASKPRHPAARAGDLRAYFDAPRYLFHNPDVRAAGGDPFEHYMRHGWREGRDPTEWYATASYLRAHPDLRARDVNPFAHWLEEGVTRGDRLRDDQPPPVDAFDYATRRRMVADSGLFDGPAYLAQNPHVAKARLDPLEHYLRAGCLEHRNPGSDFDGWWYARRHRLGDESRGAALVHFIARGRRGPTRPPQAITLHDAGEAVSTAGLRIAVHLHLFYPDLAPRFAAALAHMPVPFDLLVSVADPDHLRAVGEALAPVIPAERLTMRVTPNRGRDIAPMVVGFGDLLPRYDLVCHLHGKKSPHAAFGEAWLEHVLTGLFGGRARVAACLRQFVDDPGLGALFPDNFFAIKRYMSGGHNDAVLLDLGRRWGFTPDPAAVYPAGSMAWYRTAALAPLWNRPLTLDDFEDEAGQVEGTLAHAMERALPEVVRGAGFSAAPFYPGSPEAGR